MNKVTYTNTMEYTYEPTHVGAHYKIGNAYKNHGEYLESVAKYHRGLDYLVNPNTSYDTGSDIEEMRASVKSSGASLARVYGNTLEQILNVYFANVHSTLWIFINDIGEEITEYHMNKEEFREFLYEFGTLARENKTYLIKVRLKKVSGKMLKWLDERC